MYIILRVLSTVASEQDGPGFDLWLVQGAWSLHVLPMHARIGVNESVNCFGSLCVSPVTDFHFVQGVPCLAPRASQDGLQLPFALCGIEND